MRKRSLVIFGAIVGVLVIAGAVAWRALRVAELTSIGTGYTAQQICACVFISGRSADSCRSDLDALARRLIRAEIGTHQVTARSVAGLARATARFDQATGCMLVE